MRCMKDTIESHLSDIRGTIYRYAFSEIDSMEYNEDTTIQEVSKIVNNLISIDNPMKPLPLKLSENIDNKISDKKMFETYKSDFKAYIEDYVSAFPTVSNNQ